MLQDGPGENEGAQGWGVVVWDVVAAWDVVVVWVSTRCHVRGQVIGEAPPPKFGSRMATLRRD